jgi:HAD superfamily hydrolase (TIGR01509 family)
MTPPAVLLDVDGTLVDSVYQHALTWHRAFAQHGLAVPAWRAHRAIGMGGDMLVPALAGEEWAKEHGQAAQAAESTLFGELLPLVSALPGARDFLARLRERGHPVVLASSGKEHEVEAYLDLLDARDLVDAWTSSADAERTKPEPDILQAARERLGDPEECVVVGDSVYDIHAAHAAGLPAVAVQTGGFGVAELRDAGAAAVFEDLPELVERLDETPLLG